ncbi:hypothetical protein GHK24_04275 [Rhodocyclus tenuis]|uniref:Type 4a pilus biogenesis protein PilO n=2 Tax=Rhodocyclus TaxID=1064 RepID=A0A6L5JVA7_RHOTE|nr:hypothetical protein [Rhodocyclus gracilis]
MAGNAAMSATTMQEPAARDSAAQNIGARTLAAAPARPAPGRAMIVAHLRYLLRRAGWPALAGLALLATALAMYTLLLETTRAQVDETRAAIAKARQAPQGATRDAGSDADTLLAALPTRAALEGVIAAIHQAAARDGLLTATAEYRVRKEGELIRYEIALPVKTTWQPLRHWLAELIESSPALAIDELSLRRDSAENAPLDGRVQFTVFLRADALKESANADASGEAERPALPARHDPLRAEEQGDEAPHLFAARSWQPPPPPPPPPAKPVAPPLPFKYAGRLQDESGLRIFLSQGNTTSLVKEGDHLGNYEVVRLTASSVVLLYRPLQEKQTLIFGGDE